MDQAINQPEITVAALASSRLVYTTDIESGITRKAGKNGFLYYAPDGRRITDSAEISRLNALAIPPAYVDVRISPNPLSHLQAIGIDARGRRQYRYHPEWHLERARAKFDQLLEFGERLPDIRARVDADLRVRAPTMDKALATIVWMLDNLYIRIGNAAYAEDNGSFGLTTLRRRHVKIDGSKVKFRFKGKSGKEWNLVHTDRRIARVVRSLQELPGQQLFQYVCEDGTRRQISSQDVNEYIREVSGAEFSSRQFRTWGATCAAVTAFTPLEVAATEAAVARQMNEVIDAIAAMLVNTRAVCRSSYIHPAVFDEFKAGRLGQLLRTRPTRSKRLLKWMDAEEARVLGWLKSVS